MYGTHHGTYIGNRKSQKTIMSDYNLDKRRYVIGGVAIAIVVVYIIRLFTL